MRNSQLQFNSTSFKLQTRLEHGGDLRAGKRKLARPFDPKRSVHLVLKSDRAKGSWSMLQTKHHRVIPELLKKFSLRHHVKVYCFANVGNHLHLVVQAKTQTDFQNFLRTFSALIARRITGAKKGQARGKFWTHLAYSRVVAWGRAFRSACDYVFQNEREAQGDWKYQPRTPRSFRSRSSSNRDD